MGVVGAVGYAISRSVGPGGVEWRACSFLREFCDGISEYFWTCL